PPHPPTLRPPCHLTPHRPVHQRLPRIQAQPPAPIPDTRPGTPAADGFRMPAEFEPHAGCWMLWPERPDNWREAARPAQLAFAEVEADITQFEPVTVGVSTPHYPTARALLPERVRVVEMAHDD